MSKYKLIKDYPGVCLPVGTVVEKKQDSNKLYHSSLYYYTKSGDQIFINDVEDYPEYWQKIKQKEYEILEFIDNENNSLWRKKSNGLFTQYETGSIPKKELLNNRSSNIHSVKRLSDDEIFTIGDTIKHKTTENVGQILSINIQTSIVYFATTYCDMKSGTALKNAEHYKQPLFTTEDNVDIFEGDLYWIVEPEGIMYHKFATLYSGESKNYKYFKSEKQATSLAKFLKKKFSKKDIIDTIKDIGARSDYYDYHGRNLVLDLKEFEEALDKI